MLGGTSGDGDDDAGLPLVGLFLVESHRYVESETDLVVVGLDEWRRHDRMDGRAIRGRRVAAHQVMNAGIHTLKIVRGQGEIGDRRCRTFPRTRISTEP